jgi:ketosteroid isomerase-like protein
MDEIMLKTTHNITTNNIEVDGDTAGSESYTTSMHIMKNDGDGQLMQSVARYVDRFAKRDGEWRILTRLVVAEFSVFPPVALNPFESLARRDKTDPSYEVLGS